MAGLWGRTVTLPLDIETPAAAPLPAAAGLTPGTGCAGIAPGEATAVGVRGEAHTAAVVSFIAHGTPVGQGNIRHLGAGRPAVHQNAKTLLPWRDTIRHAATAAMDGRAPLDIPVRVDMTFTVPKPTGAPKTRRVWPSKRPDLDHMIRACLDAMTHVAFVDDARVVELRAAKRYPLEGNDALTYPGVIVRVYTVTGD